MGKQKSRTGTAIWARTAIGAESARPRQGPLRSQGTLQRWLRWPVSLVLICVLGSPGQAAVQADSPNAAVRYSPEVVAKAEAILESAGIRRSGKTLAAADTGEIGRAISGLARQRRELRLLHQDWKAVSDRIDAIRMELERLNVQDGQLSLRLAAAAGGDVATHNRYVGLINATRSQMRTLASERDRLREPLSQKRAVLNQAEADYAELVLAIRRSYREVHDRLEKSLADEKVKIALRVMAANHQSPAETTAEQILATVDKRITKIEQEVFSESIPLEVDGGSLYVNVTVGNQTTRMVVDSGASLVSLPEATATRLGIEIPSDAPQMSLILADGRSIPARGVTLERVRIGEFEAENVAAAVMSAAAVNAEPLLGMSYLGNFKFEIDTANRSLKMLRVASE